MIESIMIGIIRIITAFLLARAMLRWNSSSMLMLTLPS